MTVPTVYRELTTDWVLTMSFVQGEIVSEFLKREPSAQLRNLIGERLIELYHYQLRHLRALHADQHPGNYLLQPDGRIGLVDFGCVKRLAFDATALVRGCVAKIWRQGDQQAREILALMCGPSVPYARARKMLGTLERLAAIWYPEGEGATRVVDFGKGELLSGLGEAIKIAVKDKAANPEFAFASRAELGLHSLLYQLKSRVNVTEVWKRVDGTDEA